MERGGMLKHFTGYLVIIVAAGLSPTKAQSDSGTLVYFEPPMDTPPVSSSSYDFWWPFPAWTATQSSSSVAIKPGVTSVQSSSIFPSSSATFLSTSSISNSLPSSTSTHASSDSVGSMSSSSSVPSLSDSSTSSTSIIKITATTSPKSHLSEPTFKLIYLTPLFALLGIFAGATVAGMMYSRIVRRYQRGVQRQQPPQQDVAPDSFSFAFPPSRSMQMELGRGQVYGSLHDEWIGPSGAENTGNEHTTTENVPGNDPEGSPAMRALKAFISGSASRWFVKDEDDMAPLVPTDPNSTSSPRSKIKGSPGGPTVVPGALEVASTSPATVFSDDNLDDNEIIYGHRSHGSIRRQIAQRLRIGSRRKGRQVEEPDASKDEGNPSVEADGGTVLLGVPQTAVFPSSGPNSSGVRKVSGSKPRIENSQVFLRSNRTRRGSGHDSTGVNSTNLSSHSTGSRGMDSASDRAGTSTSSTGPSSRLRVVPSSLPRNTNMSPVASSPSRYKARSRPVLDTSAASGVPPGRSHPIPDVPQRAISPPAHPELFFADPILGHYVLPSPRPNTGKSRRLREPLAPTDGGRSRSVYKLARKQRSTPVESGLGALSSTSSSFRPARAKEVLGRVDDLVKNAYELRGTPRANAVDHFGEQQAGAEFLNANDDNQSGKRVEGLIGTPGKFETRLQLQHDMDGSGKD